MSSKGFYVQKTKRLHSRYSLSGNAVLLLKALDDFHVGIIDHAELGRIVRMSRNNRKAVTEIITKCAAVMEKQPGEMKDCIALIQNCTEILGVAALARTCKTIRNEFLEFVYSEEFFSFGCTCDMYSHLYTNKLLQASIRSVKVHWCGPKADLAFSLLASCPKLRQIHIVISKATTTALTQRQTEMLQYFPTQRSTRICDALGIDELLKLRGMTNVYVSHILAKQGARRTDEERAGLLLLLLDKLKGRRSDVF
ncbi:hypothetical protein CMQ_7474 [Grosmannia clavigera kw1407]|uniref:Uncharacterized protein n=1 Tax=Grosmannia clavigera (strain kw1407 / UAMH 11150) TaxID=655863 RepID=F0XPY4_GROCL|nr:uncharacterized protein CMQ_7474 [Grosmannia clavigera kw1407]EFX00472.1 hypothetical protein CMQ_7474 [Grosmannia clavigera kw1407]